MEKHSAVELECLSEVRRKRHGHRKKKHHRRSQAAGESPTHGSGVKSTEEVSETTSDVRSTTSTNITTECRDTRRYLVCVCVLVDEHCLCLVDKTRTCTT